MSNSIQSSRLAAHQLVSTRDADVAQAAVSRELVDSRIRRARDAKQFQFEMNGIHFGDALVAWNTYATDIEIENGSVDDTVALILGYRNPVFRMNNDAVACTASSAAVVSPSRMSIQRPAGSSILVLKASRQALERRFLEITGQLPRGGIQFDRVVDITKGCGAVARNTLLHVVSQVEDSDLLLTNASLRVSMNDLLLGTLLSLPHNQAEHLLGDVGDVAPSFVHRAEEFMEAHSAEPIKVRDVVDACGCSSSLLFRAFQKYRGYTPNEFLAIQRLEAARCRLISPSQDDSVTSIALDCGFAHLSRFAAVYKRRFGETPSETLRKVR